MCLFDISRVRQEERFGDYSYRKYNYFETNCYSDNVDWLSNSARVISNIIVGQS